MRKKIFFLILLIFSGFWVLSSGSFAQSIQEEEEVKARIRQLEQDLAAAGQRRTTLQNEISYQNSQIELTELKVTETQAEIESLSLQIDMLENSLSGLSTVFAKRAMETYKTIRSGGDLAFLLSSNSASSLFSRVYYLKKIQKNDREVLVQMQTTQSNYETQRVRREELNDRLESQGRALATQRASKEQLLTVTRNDEQRFQQLLSEAKAQLAAFSRFVATQGGASILSGQTKCDDWGCYYNQRDSEWGNLGLGGSNYSVAEYGCLVTSISMVASHYGKELKPSQIAVNSNFFVPGTGYLYHKVDGMPFSLTSVSKSSLDSELSNGPVIAGIGGGPDHFIVILRKEGDSYMMHDPFLPNGGNRPLTDEYSLSDISSLRKVSF